jgi:hypothetical protein
MLAMLDVILNVLGISLCVVYLRYEPQLLAWLEPEAEAQPARKRRCKKVKDGTAIRTPT